MGKIISESEFLELIDESKNNKRNGVSYLEEAEVIDYEVIDYEVIDYKVIEATCDDPRAICTDEAALKRLVENARINKKKLLSAKKS